MIFLTEDLTKRNHDMVANLLSKVKSQSIYSFWTIDSKNSFKESERSTPRRMFETSRILMPLPAAESEDHDSKDI